MPPEPLKIHIREKKCTKKIILEIINENKIYDFIFQTNFLMKKGTFSFSELQRL